MLFGCLLIDELLRQGQVSVLVYSGCRFLIAVVLLVALGNCCWAGGLWRLMVLLVAGFRLQSPLDIEQIAQLVARLQCLSPLIVLVVPWVHCAMMLTWLGQRLLGWMQGWLRLIPLAGGVKSTQ